MMEEQATNFKMPSKPYYFHTVTSMGVFWETFIRKVGKKGNKYIYNVEIVHYSKLNIQQVTQIGTSCNTELGFLQHRKQIS